MSDTNIDDLFAKTLDGDYEANYPWEAVRDLQLAGTREVFDRAAAWCASDEALKRARGADILAQLGSTVEHRCNSFPQESFATVSALIDRETELRPLESALYALGHLDDSRAIPILLRHIEHPSEKIRFAVTFALGSYPNDGRAVAALVQLSRDGDEDVRDWAVFGFGNQGDQDSNEIREALLERVADSFVNARDEAIVALAKRHDERVVPALLSALAEEEMSDLIPEAAGLLLGLPYDHAELTPSEYAARIRERFQAA